MGESKDGTGKGGDPLFAADRENREGLQRLNRRGVQFPCGTGGIFVAPEVDPDRIEAGAYLYPGCRITGAKTLIRKGARIGVTGPCTVHDMVLDKAVRLGSGSFEDSVLLKGVELGTAVRVRESCLLEEGCACSFSVDLKHTFLLSCVVLGSEINFCDLFMAGGTGRKDHSEVGSGVIHFNFTPFGASGDKATASLIGDAARGVFYRSKRIFIGGHTSLVGPLRIGYGSVVAAGSRLTADVGEDTLAFGDGKGSGAVEGFDFLRYKNISRKVRNSITYIANLCALWHWYRHAREGTANGPWMPEILKQARSRIARGIALRIDRMDTLRDNMEASIEGNRAAGEEALAAQQEAFRNGWPAVREGLLRYEELCGDEEARDAVLKVLDDRRGGFEEEFPALVKEGLGDQAVRHGVQWLESLVKELTRDMDPLAPKVQRSER